MTSGRGPHPSRSVNKAGTADSGNDQLSSALPGKLHRKTCRIRTPLYGIGNPASPHPPYAGCGRPRDADGQRRHRRQAIHPPDVRAARTSYAAIGLDARRQRRAAPDRPRSERRQMSGDLRFVRVIPVRVRRSSAPRAACGQGRTVAVRRNPERVGRGKIAYDGQLRLRAARGYGTQGQAGRRANCCCGAIRQRSAPEQRTSVAYLKGKTKADLGIVQGLLTA